MKKRMPKAMDHTAGNYYGDDEQMDESISVEDFK